MVQADPGATPMYVPPAFREDDLAALHGTMREARLASLVTATAEGLVATPLPLLLAPEEGPLGTLYGHVARANAQWRLPPTGDAMAMFMGPDAYVSPVLVPIEAGAREGRADLELRCRPRLWPGRVLRGCGSPARGRDAADRAARGPPRRALGRDRRAGALHSGTAQGHRRPAPADQSASRASAR